MARHKLLAPMLDERNSNEPRAVPDQSPETQILPKDLKSIPIDLSRPENKIPRSVENACHVLRQGGYKAWLAGGCVRDLLLKRQPKDWDIVTNCPVEEIQRLFPKHLDIGLSFGIVRLPPPESIHRTMNDFQIDIAIFRKEGSYSDRRHPDKVDIGDEFTDVARRDFTINAMYLDLEHALVLDYVQGTRDLNSKLIRTVGSPNRRFSEDALRLLRGIRFVGQLGFKLERETAAALRAHHALLGAVSRERIREELIKLLQSPRPILGLDSLAQHSLWEAVFGAKRFSLPADFRQFKIAWTPEPIHWICGLGVTGLLGDPLTESKRMAHRLRDLLRLSNEEHRLASHVFRLYEDCARDSAQTSGSPLPWVEIAQKDRHLVDFLKSFVRRARGPNEEEKKQAVAFLDQIHRWAARKKIHWPTADALLQEGFQEGPKLGEELRRRQWDFFWNERP